MPMRFPLRVAVLDDDFFALKGVISLLSRDLRTSVEAECDSAECLLKSLASKRLLPHVVLIDAERLQCDMPLDEIIRRIKGIAPEAVVVCWSQYGEPTVMQQAIAAGADSLLVKSDVKLALATHLIHAYTVGKTYSPKAAAALAGTDDAWLASGEMLDPWEIHPDLSPRLKQVFWLCIVYGMSVKAAASEMCVQPETVERYRMKIYDILEDGWFNDGTLSERAWERINGAHESARSVNWAFHLTTQPPRRLE